MVKPKSIMFEPCLCSLVFFLFIVKFKYSDASKESSIISSRLISFSFESDENIKSSEYLVKIISFFSQYSCTKLSSLNKYALLIFGEVGAPIGRTFLYVTKLRILSIYFSIFSSIKI